MVLKSQFWIAFIIALLAWPWLASFASAQGNYSAVTAEDVVLLELNHYFTPDRKSHKPDFEWSFTKDEFVIKAAAGAIPADLRERLLPAGGKAEEVRGKWKIAYESGVKLVLTEIVGTDRVGEEVLGRKESRLPIYRTAPDVVRIGEPQYVFGVGP
jgi:hypothetical protein